MINRDNWENIKEFVPDETDIKMLKEIETNADCQSFVSSNEAMKEIGL